MQLQEAGSEVTRGNASDVGIPDQRRLLEVLPGASRKGRLSPKRPSVEAAGLGDVFPYYAGFSFDWARSKLKAHLPGDNAVILDPWNGSGTTTLAAQSSNVNSIGVDKNPIANLVAQFRSGVAADAKPCTAPPPTTSLDGYETDPLTAWLSPIVVARVRAWTSSFDQLPQANSCLAYVAMFRVIRELTKHFEGSNPTWVRRASTDDELVEIDSGQFDDLMLKEQEKVSDRLLTQTRETKQPQVITASSRDLPISNEMIDVILTSPPYLTRIDYAVAYSRELAITGIDIAADRTFRRSLMGTTLIRHDHSESLNCGQLAQDLIRNVANHDSHASGTYYLKQFRQYLDDLIRSLTEISRVAKPGATMVMVLQDSYYKEIPVRLADICAEEATRIGWAIAERDPFEVSRTLTSVNTAAQAYPKGRVAETVLTLKRQERK